MYRVEPLAKATERIGIRLTAAELELCDRARGPMDRSSFVRTLIVEAARIQAVGEVLAEKADELARLRAVCSDLQSVSFLTISTLAARLASDAGLVYESLEQKARQAFILSAWKEVTDLQAALGDRLAQADMQTREVIAGLMGDGS